MAFLWAGGFIAAKQIAHQAGPFTISFLRFLVTAIILALIVYKKERAIKIDLSTFFYAVGAAFFGIFCYNFFFFSGIKYVDAGRGSVIISLVPIVVSVISYSLFKEKIGMLKVLGIILSVLGAWVVISKGQIGSIITGTIGWGEMYFIACTLCAAAFALLSKQVLNWLSPMRTMLTISTIGTAFLFFPAVIEISQVLPRIGSYSFMLNLLYLSIGPSVIGVIFYYDAIKKVGASTASQYMNLIPVFAVGLAFVFLGEQLTASLVVGGGFVTTGLWLTNLPT